MTVDARLMTATRPTTSARTLRAALLALAAFTLVVVCPPNGLARPLFLALGSVLSAGAIGAIGIVVSVGIVLVAHANTWRLTSLDRRALTVGYLAGIVGYLVLALNADPSPAAGGPYRDAWTYYGLGVGDPYAVTYQQGGSGYPPPLLQVTGALSVVGWPAFLALWSTLELLALRLVAGPLAAIVLLIPFVALEVWEANINLLLALAIVWSFRWPGTWSFVAVTKITPAVGVLWFAVRREWRSLAIALGVTALIVVVSVGLDAGMWQRWLDALRTSTEGASPGTEVAVRTLLAALLVVFGARWDRPALVPIAAAVATPYLWLAAASILVAVIPLARSARDSRPWYRAVDWARRPGPFGRG